MTHGECVYKAMLDEMRMRACICWVGLAGRRHTFYPRIENYCGAAAMRLASSVR